MAAPALVHKHLGGGARLAGAGDVGTWIIWLVIAAAAGAAEIMTMTLALGVVAVAALVAALAGAAGAGPAAQFGAFVAAAAAGLGAGRPLALRRVREPPLLRTGTAALIGRTAIVVEEVSASGGRVRIGPDLLASRSYDEALVIPAGTAVSVLHIEGGTALVYPRQ